MLVYRVLIQNLSMTFAEALAKITSLQTKGWRLGLDRMEEFLRRAGLDDALGHASGPHPQPLSTGAERGANLSAGRPRSD